MREYGTQFAQAGEPGGLPAAFRGGPVDDLQPGAVGPQQPAHGRFQFAVADQDHVVAERLPGEGQADAEGAGGGLHDRRAGPQFAPLTGAEQHGHGGACLHAARAEPFQLGPEAGVRAGQVAGDPGQRRTTDEGEEFPVGGGCAQYGGGHRSPPRPSSAYPSSPV